MKTQNQEWTRIATTLVAAAMAVYGIWGLFAAYAGERDLDAYGLYQNVLGHSMYYGSGIFALILAMSAFVLFSIYKKDSHEHGHAHSHHHR